MQQIFERIAKMLENTRDAIPLAGPYRVNLTGPDPTDITSCISVPVFQPCEFGTIRLSGTFANTTAVATLIVWRGDYTGSTTPSTVEFTTSLFSGRSRELVVLTATDRSIASSFISDEAFLAALGATGIKITVVGSPNGGVNLQLRRAP